MADIRGKLVGLCKAFNAHDLDRVKMFFADDCVLETEGTARYTAPAKND